MTRLSGSREPKDDSGPQGVRLPIVPPEPGPGRFWQRKRIIHVIIIFVILAFSIILTLRSSVSTAPPPLPSAGLPPTGGPDVKVPYYSENEQFLADCANKKYKWQSSHVIFPKILHGRINESQPFIAEIDLNAGTLPSYPEVVEGDEGKIVLYVQCTVAARLVAPSDNSVSVNSTEWQVREFTPTGSVNWGWSITGLKPGNHDIQLELVPALAFPPNNYVDGDTYIFDGGTPITTATLITQVRVDATWIQDLSFWWKENWPIITLIAAGVGAAILSFIKWGGAVGYDLQEAIGKWRTKSAEPEKDLTDELSAVKSKVRSRPKRTARRKR